jgi:predicted ATP-dependent serine protease
MIDVSCFCGCVYSFRGDIGVCPQCGEYATFSRVTTAEAWQMRHELDGVLDPSTAELPGVTSEQTARKPTGRTQESDPA